MYIPLWLLALVLLFMWPDLFLVFLALAGGWLILKLLFLTGLIGVGVLTETTSSHPNFLLYAVAFWMVGGLMVARPWQRPFKEMTGLQLLLLFPTMIAMFPSALFGGTLGLFGVPIVIGAWPVYAWKSSLRQPWADVWIGQPALDRLLIACMLIVSPLFWSWIGIRVLQRMRRLPTAGRAEAWAGRLERLGVIGLLAFGPLYVIGGILYGW